MPCFEPVEVPSLDWQKNYELNDYCQLACLDPCTSVRRNISGGTDPPGIDMPCGEGDWLATVVATIAGILDGGNFCDLENGDKLLTFNADAIVVCEPDGPILTEPVKWNDFDAYVLIATVGEAGIALDFYTYTCNVSPSPPTTRHWSGSTTLGNCSFSGVVLSYVSGDGACGDIGVAGSSTVTLSAG